MLHTDITAIEVVDDNELTFPDEDRVQAVAVIDELAVTNGVELELVDDEGHVVHVATPVVGRQFHPFERVEDPGFPAPHVEGYRPAYRRVRIGAVVYRALAPEDKDKTWMVLTVDDGLKRFVRTTAAARAITNDLAANA